MSKLGADVLVGPLGAIRLAKLGAEVPGGSPLADDVLRGKPRRDRSLMSVWEKVRSALWLLTPRQVVR